MIKVTFFGSSSEGYIEKYIQDINNIISTLFELDDNIVILNGGYQGLMKCISEVGKKVATSKNKKIYIQGILYQGYKNDPQNVIAKSNINNPNEFNDSILTANSIGERVQSFIKISDLIIALPGKLGTLHEILQSIEHIKYGMSYVYSKDFQRLFLHNEWEKTFNKLNNNNLIGSEVLQQLKFFAFKKDLNVFKEAVSKILLDTKEKIGREDSFQNDIIKESSEEIKINGLFSVISEIDSIKFQRFISVINSIIKNVYISDFNKNMLLGFDILIKRNNPGEILLFESLCTNTYMIILDDFLKKYSSILLNEDYNTSFENEPQIIYLNNVCLTDKELSNSLSYYNHKLDSHVEIEGRKKEIANISLWKSFLEEKEYGKTLYWVTKSVLNNTYSISCFLLFDVYTSEFIDERILKAIDEYILNEVLEETIELDKKEILIHATRSAISQVMARNMSHNIGSHVLSKYKSVEDFSNSYGSQFVPLSDLFF